jgi:hypothetical protein
MGTYVEKWEEDVWPLFLPQQTDRPGSGRSGDGVGQGGTSRSRRIK